MNERIRELAKDCGYQHIPLTSLDKVGDFDYFDIEKFAELIVKECIEQGNILANHYINTHPEQEQVLLLASIADYSNEIKEHFDIQ